mmetsp:Transcript_67894/g.189355  ORF Transcript_67894/g.189355 Transcript_67894/m.189355 type:complete len:306 (-) Transcript_67894:563-1480(-)
MVLPGGEPRVPVERLLRLRGGLGGGPGRLDGRQARVVLPARRPGLRRGGRAARRRERRRRPGGPAALRRRRRGEVASGAPHHPGAAVRLQRWVLAVGGGVVQHEEGVVLPEPEQGLRKHYHHHGGLQHPGYDAEHLDGVLVPEAHHARAVRLLGRAPGVVEQGPAPVVLRPRRRGLRGARAADDHGGGRRRRHGVCGVGGVRLLGGRPRLAGHVDSEAGGLVLPALGLRVHGGGGARDVRRAPRRRRGRLVVAEEKLVLHARGDRLPKDDRYVHAHAKLDGPEIHAHHLEGDHHDAELGAHQHYV